MATEKQLLGRIIHKHDIEENWNKATGFIPKQGEIIVYDIDDNYNYERFKIGDGNTTVINLPFQKTNINDLKAVSYDIAQTLTDEQKEQARINIGAASIEDNKPDWNKMVNKPVELAGGDTLTWDGNTDGLVCVADSFYKVSDSVPTKVNCINGYTAVFNEVDEVQQDGETVQAMFVEDGFYNDGMILIIPYDNYNIEGMGTASESGTYLYSLEGGYISSLTIPNYTGFTGGEVLIDSIIPDTVSRVGHTHSFDELEDKPFYEETTTVQGDTLSWDGNTDGLTIVKYEGEPILVLISEAVPTLDDCVNGTIFTENNGDSYSLTYEQINAAYIEMGSIGIFPISEGCTVVPYDNFSANFGGTVITFPKAGVWCVTGANYDYPISFTIPGYTGFVTTETVVQTIDSKYLPEDIARVSDIDTKLAALVNSAPDKLNTLDELAAALGDDENFANTVTTELSKKANADDLGALAFKDSLTASEVGAESSGTASSLITVHNTATDAHADIRTSLITKLDKENPVGTGSFSLNRKADTTIGNYSFAEGYDTTASGYISHAEGGNTTASGNYSHAEGYGTIASGIYSHAEGCNTTASGYESHAEGESTLTYGDYSHAEGNNTTTLGAYSHAEGYKTVASGTASHAEGLGINYPISITVLANSVNITYSSQTIHPTVGSIINCNGNARKVMSVNETNQTCTISTPFSKNEYYNNVSSLLYPYTASGDYSHREGRNTTASGLASHAEGYYTTAFGQSSHAEGYYTTANSQSQHIQGEYNILDIKNATGRGTYAHIVGNGSSDSSRSNAHTLDWSGNAWFQGDVYVGSASGTNKDEGSVKLIKNGDKELILTSSTPNSNKKFKITIDDNGVLTTKEVTE